MQQAIVKSYEEVGVKPDCEGILEIGVSYDGSWHKRGHSSHTGIGVVIDLLTGLPIDYEILSNFCQQCQLAQSSEDEIFDDWLEFWTLLKKLCRVFQFYGNGFGKGQNKNTNSDTQQLYQMVIDID